MTQYSFGCRGSTLCVAEDKDFIHFFKRIAPLLILDPFIIENIVCNFLKKFTVIHELNITNSLQNSTIGFLKLFFVFFYQF